MSVISRPGVVVTSDASTPARGVTVEGGTFFVVGAAQKGSTTRPTLVRSPAEVREKLGDRLTTSLLYDVLETFFREGGKRAFVARVPGSSAATATVTLNDGAGTP